MTMRQGETTETARKTLAARVQSLAAMAAALRRGERFPITRLTVLKSLAREARDAALFTLHLAVASRDQMLRGRRPRELAPKEWEHHKALAGEAVTAMEEHVDRASASSKARLRDMLHRIESVQDTFRSIAWGQAREIVDMPLLIIEDAVRCVLRPREAPQIAYETARHFAERYDPSYGTGLIPASAPFVEEIAAFWAKRLPAPTQAPKPRPKAAARRAPKTAAKPAEKGAFATAYPAITRWVSDCGWIEIGYREGSSSFVRALDMGGTVWEGKDTYPTLDAALAALEKRLAKWIARNLGA